MNKEAAQQYFDFLRKRRVNGSVIEENHTLAQAVDVFLRSGEAVVQHCFDESGTLDTEVILFDKKLL